MTITTALCVITKQGRWELVRDHILPNALSQGFDEVLVVGHVGEENPVAGEARFLNVPPVTDTTLDGLIKRDTAAAATKSDVLVYLCDDHRLHHRFGFALHEYLKQAEWDVLVPRRYTMRDGVTIPLPMGVEEGYCAGHAMVVKRRVIQRVPWMTSPHTRTWDVDHSRMIHEAGFLVAAAHSGGLDIEDIEHLLNPGVEPWR
jgi:hypothetical protein